jgi:hypothetical protein
MTRGFAFADLANVGAVVLERPPWLPDAGDVPVGEVVLDRPPWARGIDSYQVRREGGQTGTSAPTK